MSPTPLPLSAQEYNQPHADSTPSATGGSATQDWYFHQQSLEIDYYRENIYDSSLSTSLTTPTVIGNRLRIEYTLNVVDKIIYEGTFDNSLRILEEFEFTDGGPDLGAAGSMATSKNGIIRRAARKDSRTSAIQDPIGTCNQSGVIYLDERRGAYDGKEMTPNMLLTQLTNYFVEICPLYDASLTNI